MKVYCEGRYIATLDGTKFEIHNGEQVVFSGKFPEYYEPKALFKAWKCAEQIKYPVSN